MQVELLYHTPDPERAIATAARLCYAPVGAAELMEAMPEERVKSVLSTIMSAGHTSTLEETNAVFDEAIAAAIEAYEKLLAAGVPAEDARYLLPNAAETKIVITMNVRELLHFFSLRCCNRAQWEIREMAHRMLELAKPTAPFVFMDAGAPCIRGNCPEGKMTCGNPYPRVKRA